MRKNIQKNKLLKSTLANWLTKEDCDQETTQAVEEKESDISNHEEPQPKNTNKTVITIEEVSLF